MIAKLAAWCRYYAINDWAVLISNILTAVMLALFIYLVWLGIKALKRLNKERDSAEWWKDDDEH